MKIQGRPQIVLMGQAAVALTLMCAPLGARQVAEPFRKAADPARDSYPQGFSIVLVLGDMTPGGETQDTVPPAARRALLDMKDFLPYKTYRLLDSQWTLCCSGATSAITRLRGLDDQEYEVELRAVLLPEMRPVDGGEPGISVRFVLRDTAEGAARKSAGDRVSDANFKTQAAVAYDERARQINHDIFTLEREQADLSALSTTLRKQVEAGVKDSAEKRRVDEQLALVTERISSLKKDLNTAISPKYGADARPVIDTSFRMDIGETVVVGTSRLKGGSKALIAVLTAVGPRGRDLPKDRSKR